MPAPSNRSHDQIAAGLAAGLSAAVLVGRFVANLLYGVAPTDPRAHVWAVMLTLAAGAAAAVGPSRAAMRTPPAEALRE